MPAALSTLLRTTGRLVTAFIDRIFKRFDRRPMAAPNRMHSVEENSLIEIIASTNIDAGRKLEQQRQVDGLYSLLCDTPVAEAYRLKKLVELCQRERFLPTRLLINGVPEGTIIVQTSTTDILQGWIGDRQACLKLYRINSKSQSSQVYDASTKAAIKDIIMSWGLVHSRIVSFEGAYQIGNGFDRTYLVQAPCDTLMEYLSKWPGADCRMLLKDVAEGLAYLHDRNIAHGAVDDTAIFVDDAGRAYLSDFSQAHFEGSEFTSTTYTQTVAWLAPESLKTLRNDECMAPSQAGDIYAFGCLAYKVSVGEGPFERLVGGTLAMSVSRIVNAVCDHDRRPGTKPTVEDNAFIKHGLTEEIWGKAIEACWKRDPCSRPAASELVRILS